MYWIGLALLAVVGAWTGWTLATLPAFHLQSLTVSGIDRVQRAQVVARAAIDPRANIWLLDPRRAESRIEALPYVLSARLARALPGEVRIEVVERAPAACVRFAGGASATVDDALRVLESGCAAAPGRFYELRSRVSAPPGQFLGDAELRRLQADQSTLTGLGADYRSFAHDGFDGLRATLPGGIAVLFGDDADLPAKQRLAGAILARLGERARAVASLDLRAPAVPVVVYRPPVVHRFSTQYIQGTHRLHHNM